VRSVALAVAVIALSAASPKSGGSPPDSTTDQKVAAALENVASALKQQPNAQNRLPCGKRDENRSSDLCAQWKAADAAKSAADAAWYLGIAGAVIAVLTLYVAVRAALYAKEAAAHTAAGTSEARRSADADEKALVSTREVGAAELRPWIVIEPRITKLKMDDLGFEIRYDVVFRNVGQTSAGRLWIDMGGGFLRGDDLTGEVDEMYAQWDRAERYSGDRTLLPGEEYRAFSISSHVSKFVRWDEWSDNTRRSMFVIVASANYWSDLDRNWHLTERSFTVGEKGGDGLIDHQHLRDTLRGEWDAETAPESFAISQWRAGGTT
jgi:hypothetical protein